ncbi:nitrite reductase/ring-hydroxylating ferredoxin subunit [Nocardiopsis sp. Huas11]|uniref:Rieske 2Fe-2S domain-containing protein n=1 Tax=Nocardiopsis sp. Huas11 TaxID=2183912 RepID=UPI000EABEFE5|nr:Rieske 2Fe-2S domain-containing protein [Nocardiopsis sp. Huas11]RKS06671.1 nitrite reductase/ring-hydroxylating ferredoxin subunit [Nocardiopsis sp. Huas11]
MRLGERVRAIERDERLDPAVSRLQRVADTVPEGPVRDLLHGVQLGHPAHPVTIHAPLGAWLSAALLDLLPGDHRGAAHTLVNVGLVTALPAAVTGLVDWSRLHERQQRVGVVHSVANGLGVLFLGGSSLARARGRHGWGVALTLGGLASVGVGGYLGGYLAYYRASGANSADDLIDVLPADWTDIGALDDFAEGEPAPADLGGAPVVVVRSGATVRALLGRCTHMGAPLAEGTLVDGCLRCPWHGSEFRVDDGSVVHGPATAGLESLETWVVDGRVLVRLPAAPT